MENNLQPNRLKDILVQGGLVGVLAFILVAGHMGVWVWGKDFQEVKAERDAWKTLAIAGTQMAKETSGVITVQGTEKAVELSHDSTLDDVREMQSEIRQQLP